MNEDWRVYVRRWSTVPIMVGLARSSHTLAQNVKIQRKDGIISTIFLENTNGAFKDKIIPVSS